MARHSITNSLRQLRGSRGSAGLSTIRYGQQPLTVLYVEAAIVDMNRAEAKLMKAKALARAAVTGKRKAA